MAIDASKEKDFEYRFLERWTCPEDVMDYGGHEVALAQMRYLPRKERRWSETVLLCECDFDYVDKRVRRGKHVLRQRLHRRDPDNCPAKAAFRRAAMKRARIRNRKRWLGMPFDDLVLDAHALVKRGEYLGQHHPSMIYVQEVAELLFSDPRKVWQACDRLFAKEKLELNGAILTDFVQRFQFPKEMRGVIRYVVEEPLGWPNGDAGEGHLYELERRIQRTTRYKSGKQAFGTDNYPNIDPTILADHAFDWLEAELRQAAKDEKARERLRKLKADKIVKSLTKFIVKHPKIAPEIFARFMHELVRLSFERIEIDEAMRPGMTPELTLTEMADHFALLSKEYREKKP